MLFGKLPASKINDCLRDFVPFCEENIYEKFYVLSRISGTPDMYDLYFLLHVFHFIVSVMTRM